jgi:simple sugar transport system permease protein
MQRIIPVGLLIAALALVSLPIALSGYWSVAVLSAMFGGAFGSGFGLSETFLRAIPILLCALAAAIPAQGGQINIGGEGQLALGAIGSVLGMTMAAELNSPAMPAAMCFSAVLAGAAWSAIPATLRAVMGVNEALVSLFLNYVALYGLQFLVHGPMRDPASHGWPMSPILPETAQLSAFGASRLHSGAWIAAGLAFVVIACLYVTRMGIELRAVGLNSQAAAIVGIPVKWHLFGSLVLGGALAGLAGYLEVAGVQHRLRPDMSPGFGYSGFLVAWMCRDHLWLIIPLSILVAGFLTGAESLQIAVGLPAATAEILQGLFLLFVLLGKRGLTYAEQRRATRLAMEGARG